MKITEIKTFLMSGGGSRNWCFVKVYTDEGIYGVGEGSGWPRVVQTAVEDLANIVVGDDPTDIERLHQKMIVAMMGHGMTGALGHQRQSAQHTGMEFARWKGPQADTHVRSCRNAGTRARDA